MTIWSWLFLLPLAAVFAAAALLIYARLVGRLAWLLELGGDERVVEKSKESTPAPGHFAIYGETDQAVQTVAPPAPTEETYQLRDELLPAVDPVPVSVDPVRLAVLPRRKTESAAEEPAAVEPLPSLTPPQDPSERANARRLLVRGIYRYPWYRSSLKAWCLLTLFGLLLLVLFRAQLLAII